MKSKIKIPGGDLFIPPIVMKAYHKKELSASDILILALLLKITQCHTDHPKYGTIIGNGDLAKGALKRRRVQAIIAKLKKEKWISVTFKKDESDRATRYIKVNI